MERPQHAPREDPTLLHSHAEESEYIVGRILSIQMNAQVFANSCLAVQKSTIPPATRVRENQRRSRARRNELIEDLHRRLREYEAKKLQATLAMQAAARLVARENIQLRNLPLSKGVLPAVIERYVRGHDCSLVCMDTVACTDTQTTAAQGRKARSIESSRVPSAANQSRREARDDKLDAEEQGQNNADGEVEDQFISETSVGEPTEGVSQLNLPAQKSKDVTPGQAPGLAEDMCDCDVSTLPFTVNAEQNNMLPAM